MTASIIDTVLMNDLAKIVDEYSGTSCFIATDQCTDFRGQVDSKCRIVCYDSILSRITEAIDDMASQLQFLDSDQIITVLCGKKVTPVSVSNLSLWISFEFETDNSPSIVSAKVNWNADTQKSEFDIKFLQLASEFSHNGEGLLAEVLRNDARITLALSNDLFYGLQNQGAISCTLMGRMPDVPDGFDDWELHRLGKRDGEMTVILCSTLSVIRF